MHNALTPPWLADDAQLELTIKKGKTPLSHRRWPGEPVPLVKVERLQHEALEEFYLFRDQKRWPR